MIKQKEVLFGWGHHEYDLTGSVFSSRDKQIIEMFENYWNILEEVSYQITSSDSQALIPQNVSGYWFDVVNYTKNKYIRDMAIVEITFDGNEIKVYGNAYDYSLTNVGSFELIVAKLEPDKRNLWFIYVRSKRREEGRGDVHGSICYNFSGRGHPTNFKAELFDQSASLTVS